jgi:alpha-L-arabinofuranosidase
MSGIKRSLASKTLRLVFTCILSIIVIFVFSASDAFSFQKLNAKIQVVSISGEIISTKIGTNLHVSHESIAGKSWTKNQTFDYKNTKSIGLNSDLVEKCKALKVAVLRYPGGMTANVYRWRDGIGPIKQRPNSVDEFGRQYINRFGTIEFTDFCRALGAEKLITVNATSSSVQESANWVEFCNAKVPDHSDPEWTPSSYAGGDPAPRGYFAWLRSHFGHHEPLDVRFWEIGNEIMLHKDPGYLTKAIEFGRTMKRVDSSILIGISADTLKYRNLEKVVQKELNSDNFDFLSVHYYGSPGEIHPVTCFYSEGESRRNFHVTSAGTYLLEIEARGTKALEDPIMEVAINDEATRKIVVNSKQFQWYKTSFKLNSGKNRLAIRFINDVYIPYVGDRNLFVRNVKLVKSEKIKKEIWNTPELTYSYLFSNNALIEAHIRQVQKLFPDIPIYITEANTGYGVINENNSVVETYKLKSALWLAGLMNSAIRTRVPVICHWLLSDRYGFGIIRPDGHVTPTFYIFNMYAKHRKNRFVTLNVNSPTFNAPMLKTTPFAKQAQNVPYLDAVASYDGFNHCVITIISRHPTQSISVKFDLGIFGTRARNATVDVLNTGDSLGMEANNEKKPSNVKIRTSSIDLRKDIPVNIEPHSITNIIIALKN